MPPINSSRGQYPPPGVTVVSWDAVTEADTPSREHLAGSSCLAACMQVIGTLGGATAKMQGSNDGTNWFDLLSISNDPIAITAPGAVEFSTSALFIRPVFTGGTGQSATVIVCLRG